MSCTIWERLKRRNARGDQAPRKGKIVFQRSSNSCKIVRSGLWGSGLCLSAMFWFSGCLVDAQIETTGGSQKNPDSGESDVGTNEPGGSGGQGDAEQGPGGNLVECGTVPESMCVPHAPLGWRGPIQPQQADEPEKLLPCDAPPMVLGHNRASRDEEEVQPGFPDMRSNLFVDRVEAGSAVCRGGCESNLDIGQCFPMMYVIRELESTGPNKCGKPVGDFPAPGLMPTCEAIDPRWLTSPNHAIGAAPPKPHKGEALCEAKGTPKFDAPAPQFDGYYRLCQPKDESDSGMCPPGRACAKFKDLTQPGRMPMSCVYKPGDVNCPSGVYDDRRIVIYGSAEDERSCGECGVDHQKGELKCQYSIRLSKSDSSGTCEGAEQVLAEDICLTKEDLSGPNAPIAAFGEFLYPTYSGTCSAKELTPEGDVVLGNPVTLCCADF